MSYKHVPPKPWRLREACSAAQQEKADMQAQGLPGQRGFSCTPGSSRVTLRCVQLTR
jgi:hypothetical protein